MELLGRKRKVVREVVDSKKSFRKIDSLRGADNLYLSHPSLEDGHQDRKKRKDAHEICPRAVPSSRKGYLLDKPARGLKRKGGCIDLATRFGRKKKLDKDYELGFILGQGKFGVVKACKNRTTGQERACKTLSKKTKESIHKQVEIMQHLSSHSNVVTLSAVYEDEESMHLVMELCHSGHLIDEISRIGRYSEHQATNVIKELMVVVRYCYQMGVVHRDIKPENILRSATGQLKLADFGLSMRIVDDPRTSDSGSGGRGDRGGKFSGGRGHSGGHESFGGRGGSFGGHDRGGGRGHGDSGDREKRMDLSVTGKKTTFADD